MGRPELGPGDDRPDRSGPGAQERRALRRELHTLAEVTESIRSVRGQWVLILLPLAIVALLGLLR